MFKMSMVWVAVAKHLHSNAGSSMTKSEIDKAVFDLFQVKITPAMIESHLVSTVDRQADTSNPQRGGSRNRYLYKEKNGRFRLYNEARDKDEDGWDKDGPCHPDASDLPPEYQYLVDWYRNEYATS